MMESWKVYGLIAALACLLIFAPVAACNPSITKTCDQTACINCPTTCTITVTPYKEGFAYQLKVVDTLPTGATLITSPDGGSYSAPAYTWWPVNVPANSNAPITLTIKFTPSLVGTFQNKADAWAKLPNDRNWYGSTGAATSNVVTVNDCTESPEFPTVFLPATMIIGILGSVLIIRKMKE